MKELIEKIEACETLDFETKLEALCEIEARLNRNAGLIYQSDSVLGLFLWIDTPQGHEFWGRVNYEVH